MTLKQSSAYCPHCARQVLTVGRAPNHLLHLVLSLLTAGVWLLVWLLVAISSAGNYRCSSCGTPV